MDVAEGVEQQGTPPLPTEIKVLACASVAGQVAVLPGRDCVPVTTSGC